MTVPKIAAVERRQGARAGHTACGRLRKRCPEDDLRRSGAPPPSGEATKTRAKARKTGQGDLTIRATASRGDENACARSTQPGDHDVNAYEEMETAHRALVTAARCRILDEGGRTDGSQRSRLHKSGIPNAVFRPSLSRTTTCRSRQAGSTRTSGGPQGRRFAFQVQDKRLRQRGARLRSSTAAKSIWLDWTRIGSGVRLFPRSNLTTVWPSALHPPVIRCADRCSHLGRF